MLKNWQAMLLAEAIGWLLDYSKYSEEHLKTQAPHSSSKALAQMEPAKMSKPQQQEYEKAKKWWEREGKAMNERPATLIEPTPEPTEQRLQREFGSFTELLEKVIKVGKALVTAGDEE
ncbi:MAG: hypothetical protein ONB24_15365 [candidate division KSB1 bacterium]|nr:hypothetical protein [candidate division KSB1 bacterium]